MHNVLITHGIRRQGLTELLANTNVIMPPMGQAFSLEELLEALPDMDAVLACGEFNEAAVYAGKKLQIISNYGAGYDRVNVPAATKCGVPLTNIPDATTLPTAEVAIGLLLSCCRRIPQMNALLRTQAPESLFGAPEHMATSLQGLTLGILGMGRIGQAVSAVARILGMQVVYFNRNPLPADKADGATYLPLDDMLAACDVLSIHCPLTEQTRGLLCREKLALMKHGAILINTARGAIVETAALCEALRSGQIAFAGLDVFPDEPHVPAELISLPNAILTPHIGTHTEQARDAMAHAAAERILIALSGKRPPNVVNPEVYEK